MESPVIHEEDLDLDFIHKVYSIPGGEKIRDCIQCGSCSGSCPTSPFMEHSPRRLFAMIRAGMKDQVLQSNTIWICSSCYTCTVRCPQEIKITDIMYALKQIAFEEGKYARGHAARELSKIFSTLVKRYGRNHEGELMTRFFLKTNPIKMMGNALVGLTLMKNRRMPTIPHRIKGIKKLRKIIEKVEKMEGY